MKETIKELADKARKHYPATATSGEYWVFDEEMFAKLIIEETLKEVDLRCYGRGENQWYYDDDKRWVRLHFGYGEFAK